jgi:rhamnosyltransferase subunit B
MSRFLFTTFGSLGDLHPYIAVGRALLARGHQAMIAAAEEYRAAVEAAGLDFAPVPPCMAELDETEALVRKLFDERHGPEYLIRHLVMPHLRGAYDALMPAAAGADLLISHPLTYTLPLVAEQRGLPWVATVLAPMSFMSAYEPPLIASAPWLQRLRLLGPGPYRLFFKLIKLGLRHWERPLRDLRAELGLPPSPHLAMFEGQFSPLANLALFDPHLAAPQPDWPTNTRVCGSPLYDGSAPDEETLRDMERFLAEGEAPLVFALGSSAIWFAGDFWAKAAHAARALGRRAILVTGHPVPQELPPGVRAFPYLPYSLVFPRAAAVIHQAGIGTLAQAMRAGRPQLIVPVSFDQPDNAARTAGLGVARVIPFRKVSAERLTSELDHLLNSPDYGTKARALAEELAKVDGAARTAEELIACLEDTRISL